MIRSRVNASGNQAGQIINQGQQQLSGYIITSFKRSVDAQLSPADHALTCGCTNLMCSDASSLHCKTCLKGPGQPARQLHGCQQQLHRGLAMAWLLRGLICTALSKLSITSIGRPETPSCRLHVTGRLISMPEMHSWYQQTSHAG